MEVSDLVFAMEGGRTKRYHTTHTLQEQTVAAHSYGVAHIAAWLANQTKAGVGPVLLLAALSHDVAEQVMGDLPSPSKRALPPYVEGRSFREVWGELEQEMLASYGLDFEALLSDEEKHILKLADVAEGCFFCIRERAMGNSTISEVWRNFISYYWELANESDEAERNLGSYFEAKWRRATGQ